MPALLLKSFLEGRPACGKQAFLLVLSAIEGSAHVVFPVAEATGLGEVWEGEGFGCTAGQ